MYRFHKREDSHFLHKFGMHLLSAKGWARTIEITYTYNEIVD